MPNNDSFPKFIGRLAVMVRGIWKEGAAACTAVVGANTFLSKNDYVSGAYNSMITYTRDPINTPWVLVGIIAVGSVLFAVLYCFYYLSTYFKATRPDMRLRLFRLETPSEAAPDLRLVTADQWPVVRGNVATLDEPETVKPGDKLVFAVTPTLEGHAYLLHVNEVTGRIKVMWPNKRDRDNAVRPKEPFTVPQKGPDYIKVATGDVGLETFFLVECSTRLEASMPQEHAALPNNLADLSDEQATALLGVLEARCRAARDRPGITMLEVRSVAA